MKHRRYAGVVAGAFLAVFLVSATARAGAIPPGKPGPGDPAPMFTAQDLQGRTSGIEGALRSGGVVLLNFWGMRCGNCITEIGHLNSLNEKYAPVGAVFLGVNVDGAPAETLNRMMPKMPNVPKFTVIPDPDMKIPDLYQFTGAPLSIIIGRDGKIAWRHEDFKEGDEKEIERALKEALAAKPR
jgi:cytochrome c biogenesis protein CcmG/thiol:disulfide interchange protein DsbE